MKCPLGRIRNIHPTNNGFIRGADVKTASKIFKCPMHSCALVPVKDSAATNQNEILTANRNIEPEIKRK